MRRCLVVSFIILLLVIAQVCPVCAEEAKLSIDYGAGYRTDEVDWNIASGGISPLSELEWSNLQTVFAKSTIRISYNRFHAKGSIDYGKTLDGDNRDSDWAVSGRQSEFSRSNNSADGGYVFDASVGVGYEFPVGKLTIIPLIGYSWHLQHLEITDGYQTICDTTIFPGCTVGPFAGLNSTYDARWQGVWFGVDLNANPSDKLRLYTSLEYHYGDFVGEGWWNLRELGFEQLADAEGYVIAGGFAYAIKDSTDIGLELQYTDWESKSGQDAIYWIPGATSILNEANWESFSIMFNATHRFFDLNKKRLTRL